MYMEQALVTSEELKDQFEQELLVLQVEIAILERTLKRKRQRQEELLAEQALLA